ncbi:unnamed protein product [Moneuplotes crassus]|uniref:tRNA-binding domain-containing protein n=1 Tax=Euplotes crassus TaxID=5936 RepID=A0AAD1ULP8_EUPCR|nr:unnamed protein product [Moneuplotes crassus]
MTQIFLGTNLKSLAVEIMAKYTRAIDAELVKITTLTPEVQKETGIPTLPCMIVTEGDRTVKTENKKTFKCASTYAIFRHIAELTRFEKIFLGKSEIDNARILSYFELINSMEPQALADHLNNDLKFRVFVATYNITAADIYAYAHIAEHVKGFDDLKKLEYSNLFRWLDHIQHLPGLDKFAIEHSLFVEFPDENAKPLSKSEMKKLAKEKYKKEQKEAKAAAKAAGKTEGKKGKEDKKETKDQTKNEEEKKEVTTEGGQKPKKQKQKQAQNKGGKKGEVDYSAPPITLVDIRVGQITKVWKHPDSTKLYCEEIDIGEEKPRSIASGLQEFVPIEKMENAMVCVAANLKAKKLGGFPSQGMVLCAQNDDHTAVELLTPPAGAKPGDIVRFEGFEHNAPRQLNPKKKIFEAVQKDFKVDANGIAFYQDLEWKHENGKFTAETIRDGVIG